MAGIANTQSYDQFRLSSNVALCITLSLPGSVIASSKKRRSSRTATLPEALLFALYRDGRVAYGVALTMQSNDTDKITDACLKIRDRAPKMLLDTRLGPVLVGPDSSQILEFESTWRDRIVATPKTDASDCTENTVANAHLRPVHDAIRQFEKELDATWLAACPLGLPNRYRAYNWLQRQDAEGRLRFIQAAQAYSFLWNLLLELRGPAAEALRQSVRDATPISATLGELLGAAPWQLRALRDAFVSSFIDDRDIDGYDHLLAHVRALDHIKPEQVPKTPAGWEYLSRAMEQLHFKPWMAYLAQAGLDALASGKGVPKFWRSFAKKSGLRRQLSGIEDFFDYAARFPERQLLPADWEANLRAVVESYARWKEVVDPRVLAYYYDQALPFWKQQSVRAPWEQEPQPAFPAEPGEALGPVARALSEPVLSGKWTPLMSSDTTVDGHFFVELSTAEALREEGYVMRHCVGQFAERCEARGVRIFSVRGPTGDRSTTLEIWHAGGHWRISQHFGKANSRPSDAAVRAAAKLVDLVNGDRGI